jgi:hypothetical protein
MGRTSARSRHANPNKEAAILRIPHCKKTQRQARRARRWVMLAWFWFDLVEIGRVDLGEARRVGRQLVQREHGI